MIEILFSRLRFLGGVLLLLATATLLGAAAIPAALLVQAVHARAGVVGAAFSLPFAWIAWGIGYAVLVVVVKRATFTRLEPGTHAFFSVAAMRWAAIGFFAEVAHWLFLRFCIGTDLIVWWYRALGAKIGDRVTIATTQISDWDLLTIDDDAFVGGHATIIGHVGEMGRLKLAPVHVGRRCSVGHQATIFPGTTMEDGSVLGAHALSTKGQVLKAGGIYGGAPARFLKDRVEKPTLVEAKALQAAARQAG